MSIGASAAFTLCVYIHIAFGFGPQAKINKLFSKHYVDQLLLISFDGFRWDYLTKTDTPNFDRMIGEGAYIEKMVGEFATVTFPSHWTLVTGVYQEVHGIVDNVMFDPVYNDTFSYSDDGKWYNNTMPIWAEVQQQARSAATFFWPGSDASINGIRPTFWRNYQEERDESITKQVDTVIEWLKLGINFVTLYYPEPDSIGHSFGPDSFRTRRAIEMMDCYLGSILDKLEENGLTRKVNVILTSDHGMSYRPPQNNLKLSDYVNLDDLRWYENSGAVGNILPKDLSMTEELYNNLTRMPNATVYLKENFPNEYHFAGSRRVHPIIVLPDQGFYLSGNKPSTFQGHHGYRPDLDDMKPLLIARGPNFRCGYVKPEGRAIDVYALMAELLRIVPHPHNGSLERMADIVVTNSESCWISSSAKSFVVELWTPVLFILLGQAM